MLFGGGPREPRDANRLVVQIQPAEGIQVHFHTKVPDAAAALRDYASQGFDIVIAHGSQYGTSVEEIAKEFPKTTFAWGTDVNTFGLDNVYAYTAAAEEGGYVNGVMAAKLTKNKLIGVTGPVEVGDAKTYIDGFTNVS